MEVPADVGELDELRQLTGRREIDFALVLSHLGRDPSEFEARVHALLRVPSDPLVVAEDAVFVHLQAAALSHRPQPDVVVFRTREVLQPGTPTIRVEDPQVHLDRSPGSFVVVILETDDDLRLAGGEDLDDAWEALEGRPRSRAVLRDREDVDVAHGFPHPPERAGRLDPFHGLGRFHSLRNRIDDPCGINEERTGLALLDQLDCPEDVLFRLLAEPFDPAKKMFLGRRLQRVEIRDPELLPQDLHLLRPEPSDLQQVQDARREFGSQLVVVSDPTRRDVLHDFLVERASKWRAIAPQGFRFCVKASQFITHEATSPTYRRSGRVVPDSEKRAYGSFRDTPHVREGWEATSSFAKTIRADAIVFQTPASFGPTEANRTALYRFFESNRTDATKAI